MRVAVFLSTLHRALAHIGQSPFDDSGLAMTSSRYHRPQECPRLEPSLLRPPMVCIRPPNTPQSLLVNIHLHTSHATLVVCTPAHLRDRYVSPPSRLCRLLYQM